MDSTILYIFIAGLVLAALAGVGLSIPPRALKPHTADPEPPLERRTLPPGMPAPLMRHLQQTIGAEIPVARAATVWGRASLHVSGLWLPLRFQSWYAPGAWFHRRFQITLFGRPVLRGKDWYVDGQGVYRIGERLEVGKSVDQSQNLAMWAESVWMPSAWLFDTAARLEAVDDQQVRLIIPTPDGQDDSLMLHFDAATGCMTHLTAMRYRADDEATVKEPWRMDLLEWKKFNGMELPCRVALAWGESVAVGSYWSLDGIAYNVAAVKPDEAA